MCAKTVVDFSNKSDADIQKFLLENSGQKICGRFKVNQLERPTQIDEIPRLKIEKPKFEFPGFLIPVLTPFRACAMSLMIFASAALMGCGNAGSGGGDDERLAGTIALVDSTYEEPQTRIQGGISIKQANDSTCVIKKEDELFLGEISYPPPDDTVKTDTTETMIKGEVEPGIKMGMLKRTEPEEEVKHEKDYKKGEVKAEY